MQIRAASETGKVREINEDSYCSLVHPRYEGLRVVAVADGMGGHQAGEVASQAAIDFLQQRFERLFDLAEPEEWLVQTIHAANSMIIEQASHGTEHEGMGTTLTGVLLLDHRQKEKRLPPSVSGGAGEYVYCAYGHVGDSRMYLYRGQGKGLRRVTNDHSLVGELLRNGSLTEEEAQRHPQRNYLTQALGSAENIEVESGSCELEPGSLVLLCTDGLSSLVSEEELERNLETLEIDTAAEQLLELALARGGQDNVTVVLVQVREGRV